MSERTLQQKESACVTDITHNAFIASTSSASASSSSSSSALSTSQRHFTIDELLQRRMEHSATHSHHDAAILLPSESQPTTSNIAAPVSASSHSYPTSSLPPTCIDMFTCVDPAYSQLTQRHHQQPHQHYWPAQVPIAVPPSSYSSSSLQSSSQPVHTSPSDSLLPLGHQQEQWRAKWREIVMIQLPKHHSFESARSILQQQQRSRLCTTIAREYVRLLHRQYRCIRDVPSRSRRIVREVASFWRRAERDSVEIRRRAEREEIEQRRRQAEQAEQERQKKKLEFLLTQTELYAHFIGRRMNRGTSGDIEASSSAAAASSSAAAASSSNSVDPTTSSAIAAAASSSTSSTPAPSSSPSSLVPSPSNASLLAHASTVRDETTNITADEAARKYITNQRAKMSEFDQLEEKTREKLLNKNGANNVAAMSDTSATPANDDVTPNSSATPAPASSSSPAPAEVDPLDLLNPSTMPETNSFVSAAKTFHGTLKSYQLRGLNWLLNLYEQGINGILADEMGLGKTVQSISFLSYLASVKNIWGPFLIVAPNSTLHQWQQEVAKFSPDLRILPYWGTAKERQALRSYWSSKQLYTREAPFHVLITSYNIVVQDEKYFARLKFMYMILDEAHALKNAQSQRWKCLLNLKCRNRVLLTGTPIQNSMNELWALLHFIMPEFFGSGVNSAMSYNDFAEWFSKDVESSAASSQTQKEDGTIAMDQHQLSRLHMILKPFMLRRIKKDVENEMPLKIELTLPCRLSRRQLQYYKALQKKIFTVTGYQSNNASTSASIVHGVNGKKATSFLSFTGPATFSSTDVAASDSLVTLVMQFRKVCNHPELYEEKPTQAPMFWGEQVHYKQLEQKAGVNDVAEDVKSIQNALFLRCPAASQHSNPLAQPYSSLLHQAIRIPSREKLIGSTMSIWTTDNMTEAWRQDPQTEKAKPTAFGFLPSLDISAGEMEFLATCDIFHAWFAHIVLEHRRSRSQHRTPSIYAGVQLRLPPYGLELLSGSLELVAHGTPAWCKIVDRDFGELQAAREVAKKEGREFVEVPKEVKMEDEEEMIAAPISSSFLTPRSFTNTFHLAGSGLVWRSPASILHATPLLRIYRRCCRPRVIATPAYPQWYRSRRAPAPVTLIDEYAPNNTGWEKSVLLGVDAWKWSNLSMTHSARQGCTYPVSLQQSLDIIPKGLVNLQKIMFNPPPSEESETSSEPTNLLIDSSQTLPIHARTLHSTHITSSTAIIPGLFSPLSSSLSLPTSRLLVPTVEDLITDSGKLQVLDTLLKQLKREGHRVLIFSQFTKLIDLLENFLKYRKYKFARLDGQTALTDRRDLVANFQHDQSVFAFLLSTRAGGLGINLTAADTVVFYDNDWNPSSDAQAMDRVHRIGQTRQVTVYRLVCVNTVEERILIRAQQKHAIQTTVYSGGFKMAGESIKSELQELFSGEELKQLLETDPGASIATTTNGSASLNASSSPPPFSSSTLPTTAHIQSIPTKTAGVKHPLDTQAKTNEESSQQAQKRAKLTQ